MANKTTTFGQNSTSLLEIINWARLDFIEPIEND